MTIRRFVHSTTAALLLLSVLTTHAQADKRSASYRDAHRHFKALRDEVFQAQVATSDAGGLSGTRRAEVIKRGKQGLQAARAAAERLRAAVEAMKKKESWKASVAQFESKLKQYEEVINKYDKRLAALETKQPEDKTPAGEAGQAPKQPTVDLPLGGEEPGQPAPSDYRSPPHVPLEVAVALWDMTEMLNELQLWEQFCDTELRGQGLLDRTKESFARHGATNHYAQTWAMWLGHYTHGGLSPSGNWHLLPKAIDDFLSPMSRAKKLAPAHEAYVQQLRVWMGQWRKDARNKSQLLLKAVEAMSRMAVAYEADDDARSAETRERYNAIVADIQRKPHYEIYNYREWLKRRTRERNEAERKRRIAERDRHEKTMGERPDGTTLSEHDVKVLIEAAKKKLAAKGLPTKWLDDVLKDLPEVSIDREKNKKAKAGGLYGEELNEIQLPSEINVIKPSDEDLSALVHELFHSWYDTKPDWYDLWLNENQNETVAAYLGYSMYDWSFSEVVDRSLKYGVSKGGNAGESIKGLMKVHKYFGDEGLITGPNGPKGLRKWEQVKKEHLKGHEKEAAKLEAFFRK